jgi:hypothetical protein
VQLSNANPHALFATHFILEACTVKKGFNLSKNATRDALQKRVFDHVSILKSRKQVSILDKSTVESSSMDTVQSRERIEKKKS